MTSGSRAGAVAKVDIPYVKAFKDRHKHQRYYFRRAGFPSKALRGSPGTALFASDYDAAMDGKIEKTPLEGPKSIGAGIDAFYKIPGFKKLAKGTRATHKGALERFRHADSGDGKTYGQRSAISTKAQGKIQQALDNMSDRPAAAEHLRKCLRLVFANIVKTHQQEGGWRPDNPMKEIPRVGYKVVGFLPWEADDCRAFEAAYPSGSRERRAYALLRYTTQRRADVTRMGSQHVRSGHMAVTQGKTGTQLLIPIHAELQREIDLAPPGLTFVLTEYGAPFTPAGFTAWFVKKCEAAGIYNRTPHGLRKFTLAELAESGCTANEIASVSGHKSLSEVTHYTQSADQKRMAGSAMNKLKGLTAPG